MNEEEWLTTADAWAMLQVVQRLRPSVRKVRLFNAAICRRFWDYLPEASRVVLVASELYADEVTQPSPDRPDLCHRANAAVAPLDRQYPTKRFPSREVRIQRDAAAAVCYAVTPGELWGAAGYFWDIDPAEKTAHAEVIRDIMGNPFRPVAVQATWLTTTVTDLAHTIYAERAFHLLPVLADALEEAGCDDRHVLEHCRGPGPHARGCWVVDRLTCRE